MSSCHVKRPVIGFAIASLLDGSSPIRQFSLKARYHFLAPVWLLEGATVRAAERGTERRGTAPRSRKILEIPGGMGVTRGDDSLTRAHDPWAAAGRTCPN